MKTDAVTMGIHALFQYLGSYGSSNCPSDDGLTIAEAIQIKGRIGPIEHDTTKYNPTKEYGFKKALVLNDPETGDDVEILMDVRVIVTNSPRRQTHIETIATKYAQNEKGTKDQ